MMTIKKHWRQLLTTVLLVVIGVGLSLYLFQDSLSALMVRQTHISVDAKTVAQNTDNQSTKKVSYNFDAVKPLSLTQLSQASLRKHRIGAVGKLVIPQVKLDLPIALGVGNAELAFAAGTLNPNQRMGEDNYALAGHHMTQDETLLFGPLVKTSVGMVAYISDMKQIYGYQIYARKYIKATDVYVLNHTTQPELTLVTCDDDGTGRLMVKGRLVQTYQFNKAPAALQKLVNQE